MHWIALLPTPCTDAPGHPELPVWHALRFTPRVAWVPVPARLAAACGQPRALVLEVAASERLFGGREALLQAVLEPNPAFVQSRWALGATSLIAIARLDGWPDAQHTPPGQLPLAALQAADPHLDALAQLGVTRWGQLQALPRAGVARRFGATLPAALDQALGCRPEVHAWCGLPAQFVQRLELPAQVDSAEGLLAGAGHLLHQLRLWLLGCQQGVLALRLVWHMDRRRDGPASGELLLRTAAPTPDTHYLLRLLREHLARVRLPAPVHSLELRSEQTAAPDPGSASLLAESRRQGERLHQLVERLSARLGPQQVLGLHPLDDHRPEAMQGQHAARDAIEKIANNTRPHWTNGQFHSQNTLQEPPESPAPARQGLLYPSWLLPRPVRLQERQHRPLYQGPLTLLAGPQRLESGWWAQADAPDTTDPPAALRDYFVARSAQAGLLWIYRERLPRDAGSGEPVHAGWYLHGLFA